MAFTSFLECGIWQCEICRDDEFDLDLEEIMVMEAIWLSIQVAFPAYQLSEIVQDSGCEIGV